MQQILREPTASSLAAVEREIVLLGRLVMSARRRGGSTDPRMEQSAYLVLGWLAERGPVRAGELASVLHLDASTVSRQVAALERLGHLSRDRDPDDARASRLRPTPEGTAALTAERAARWQLVRAMLASWSEEEKDGFATALARFNNALHETLGADTTGHHAP